ncbi:ABC transporter ATP-binding protein [Natronospirillum operosum]|uniref:ABC transporter ATP-binding protein n=1 Tax=Natronospirillum operosum TaxID=2759953 RepID=A0A4Z0WAA8_9GAMM|nr:ABC transporter ATP-binding protein [Natronospirillum operosum]TGG95579.1 ABC transporter ATP-binding protein [Natronospirillum operosum]
MSESVLSCRELTKSYQIGPEPVWVFDGLNLDIQAGDMVSIVGTSGAGKSTLLHLMAGLDLPSSGAVTVDGEDLSRMSERRRSQVRNETLGFVFQFHHLLHEFTALDNVLMPTRIRRKPNAQDRDYALSLLEGVGVAHRAEHKPSELSGGERQRVAIARSLMNRPRLVLMDEPTGNLDTQTSGQIQELILGLNKTAQCSFVVVTHNHDLAARMPVRYRLEQGRLEAY